MVIDGGRGPEVLLEAFQKSPCRFYYVLLITIQFVTLVLVDYLTFLCDAVPSLRIKQKVCNDVASFEMDLDPHLIKFFKLLLKPLVYGTSMYMFLLVLLLLMVLWLLVEWMLFLFIWAWLVL